MGLDTNIAAAVRATRSSVSGPNNPNIVRDDQDNLLKHYKNKHEEDTCLFLQFMEHDNSSPPPNKKYPQRKNKSTDFLIDNHSSKNNVRVVVKPPKHYEVVCVNDESLSVTTSDIYANNTTTICQISNVGRRKQKRRNILTNKSSKSSKTIKANDKGEERKCPRCKLCKHL